MRLLLVQHGEACAKEIDPDRPLTDRGKDPVWRRFRSSGKLRARQTAARLAEAIAPGVVLETSGLIHPNDNPRAFDWQSGSWDRDTLVVGHLPFLARLVSHLLIGDEDRTITAFEPGTVACLELGEGSQWRLVWMIRPELLPGHRA